MEEGVIVGAQGTFPNLLLQRLQPCVSRALTLLEFCDAVDDAVLRLRAPHKSRFRYN